MSSLTIPPGISSGTIKVIPDQWSAQWFRQFITLYLQDADTRNTIAGTGINIAGKLGTPATISSTAIVGSPLSVFGNPTNTETDNGSIIATANGQVLQRSGNALVFGTLQLATPAGLGPSFSVAGLTAGTVLQATLDGATAAFSPVIFPTAIAPGDIVVGNGVDILGSLPVGVNTQLLSITADAPAWVGQNTLAIAWSQITGTPTTLAGYGIVLPVESAGWGAPTGAAVQNNFSGTGASLAQTSAAVAELIANLQSLGILGA